MASSLPLNTVFHELEVESSAREQARIASRRARDAARMERLLDARTRVYGRQEEHMQEQIAAAEDARRAAKEEKEREAAAQSMLSRVGASIAASHAQARAEEAARTREILRHQMETAHLRTTADLNSKAVGELPVRRGDDDPRLGVSSVQVMDGEDRYKAERVRLQREQMAVWARDAAAVKAAAREEEEKREKEHAESVMLTTAVGKAMEDAAAERRKHAEARAREYNAVAAEERRAAEAARRRAELEADDTSLSTMVTHGASYGFLGGDLSDAVAAHDPRRYRVDHYRGAPPAALTATQRAREMQMSETQRRKEDEAARDAAEAAERARIVRVAAMHDRAVAQRKAEERAELARTLQKQAEEAAARRAAEEAARKGLRVGDGFFGRFGTSDR